ncbi:hypothetical protein EYZ11_010034 [Aspergillus tanneri]|uniref:Calcium-transporting ATPase 2 n=1 Tax=Aspergillus tanneri TaxID=1220188 RepID=A0A4S3J8H3_9EURO|nr:hypothetical protein EYZ11_010034 [Aspergillus tanneri]
MSSRRNPKNWCLKMYSRLGIIGLAKGLHTDARGGLSMDETVPKSLDAREWGIALQTDRQNDAFAMRKQVFGDNHLPLRKPPTILQLLWMAYNDHVLFLLTGAAIISLALGLYQTFATRHGPGNPPVEWVEGVAILVAVVIIVLVSTTNDYQKQRKFQKLNRKKQDRDVKVIRSARSQEVPIYDLMVGDVVLIDPGDVIPADGILIQGHRVQCDESSATGETEPQAKHPGNEVFSAFQDGRDCQHMDPFLISGTKVTEGVGSFLVLATGLRSTHGKIILSLDEEPDFTPLQLRLNTLAKYIARFGVIISLLLFVILFIRFLVGLRSSSQTPAEKGQSFLNIFITALTVLVIAVPEGLPLTVTLALAFATTRMLKDNNLVRLLRACETMGNATDICSDKTGTLTQNKMIVVSGCFGDNSEFERQLAAPYGATTNGDDKTLATEYIQSLPDDTRIILKESIVTNTTAVESDSSGEASSFLGSNTEAALLQFCRSHLGMGPVDVERANVKIVELFPFDASRQCMLTVVQQEDGRYRVYVKGAPEVLLRKCTRVVESPAGGLATIPITETITQSLQQAIARYATKSLRTIGLCFRDLHNWPLTEDIKFEDFFADLTFLAVFGIRDPLRNGAEDAVRACLKAGVAVRMVTGDNALTARAIATECGILVDPDDVVMEGHEFRQLSQSQQTDLIPHLKVLARSLPDDKRTLVARLQEAGRVVAVTGDGTNDAPALATADVGFSMGISGTEIAREASSIVLMDDNFSSIVKAVMWGRAVGDAVKRFLQVRNEATSWSFDLKINRFSPQFQITITITSVGLAFVSAIASSEERSVLTAVQLMWVNLFQDTLAALALATDPPTERILNRKPEPKNALTLVLHFAGSAIFSYHTEHEKQQLQTAVFNTYVWLQIFNIYNNRQLEKSINIFEGVLHNWLFIAINVLMIGIQILIMFVGGRAFSIERYGTLFLVGKDKNPLEIPRGWLSGGVAT